LEQIEEVDEEVGHGLVLAGLARKDDEELQAAPVEDRIDHGADRGELVVVEARLEDGAGEGSGVREQVDQPAQVRA